MMFTTIDRPFAHPVHSPPATDPQLNPSPTTAVLDSKAADFPAVPRFSRALTPTRKRPGFVPEMNYTGLTPLSETQKNVARFSSELNQMAKDYPDVLLMARDLARAFIKEHTGKDLDPDKTFFLRFHEAFTGPKAHSGWRHGGPPSESMTLTRLFMQRFTSRDEMNILDLDQLSGLYEVSSATLFDETNEVPLLPSILMKALWKIDFSGMYNQKVDAFWKSYSTQFRENIKASLMVEVLAAQDSDDLSTRDYLSFMKLLTAPEFKADASIHRTLNAEIAPTPELAIYPFNILGHDSTDMLIMVNSSGEQILYVPGAIPAVASVKSREVLYEWIKEILDDPTSRRALLAHFPARAMDQGLNQAVEKIVRGEFLPGHTPKGTGAYDIVKYNVAKRITSDVPSALRDRLRDRMKDDGEFHLRSNSEISRQQWIDSLSDFSQIGGALAPLAPLVALPVLGADLVRLGLNIDKAITADTSAERQAGAVNAAAGAIDVLFNLPLLVNPKKDHLDIPGDRVVAEDAVATGTVEETSSDSLDESPLPSANDVMPPIDSSTAPDPGSITAPIPVKPLPAELVGFALPINMREFFGVKDPSRVLFNQGDGRHYLEVLGRTFWVRYDRALGAWVIIDPKKPYAFFGTRPVRLGADNTWELVPSATLRGGSPIAALKKRHSVLAGITVTPPRGNQVVQRFKMVIDGQPVAVKYHPPSNTWRTQAGAAYRHNPLTAQADLIANPDRLPAASPQSMETALKGLGMDITYPLDLAAPDTRLFEDIPRHISSIWLGKRMPVALMNNLERNAVRAGRGKRPFDTTLYLSIQEPGERSLAIQTLKVWAPHVRIEILEDTAFFQTFKASPLYGQYLDATKSRGGNLSSASDLLRYPLLDNIGGIFSDCDDTIRGDLPDGKLFGDLDFKTGPNGLLLNQPVSHELLGMNTEFNSSNFGSRPNNPVLRRVSERMANRFQLNPSFYQSRPYQGSDTPERMREYAHELNDMTGPGVLNTAIDDYLPEHRQFCSLLRIANGELYMEPAEIERIGELVRRRHNDYAPLGDLIDINSTSSWLDNR